MEYSSLKSRFAVQNTVVILGEYSEFRYAYDYISNHDNGTNSMQVRNRFRETVDHGFIVLQMWLWTSTVQALRS